MTTAYDTSVDAALRSLLAFYAFLDENRERLADVNFDLDFGIVNVTPDELQALASCPGGWEKDGDDKWFRLTRKFGAVEFEAYGSRDEICEARPTGRKVTAHQIVKPAEWADVEVDEIEWVCAPLLAKERAVGEAIRATGPEPF